MNRTAEASVVKRHLWVIEKQFDVARDTATWLEMAANLQGRYDIRLLGGYRDRMVQPDPARINILYYPSLKIPCLNLMSTHISQYRQFPKVVASFRPNVVLFNSNNFLLLRYAVLIKKRYDLKLIFDVRSIPVGSGLRHSIYNKLFGLSMLYAAKHFDGVTYITEEMRRFCISIYNLPSHPSAIWTSGVNAELFCPEPDRSDKGPFRILYHGSVGKRRRLDKLIKSMALLKDIDVQLDFLGGGDAWKELRNLTVKLGSSDRVTFLDGVSYHDVPHWINRAHAGIIPLPNWSGWNISSPIKLFEYLSCGKPVIVTDIPAHRSVLDGCDFAFWAEGSSPKALANAIRWANQRRSRFDALGRKARDYVMKDYTWKQQANKLAEFLETFS